MKITSLEEYGLRCLLQLARSPREQIVSVKEIAAKEGMSHAYVEKLLRILSRAGLRPDTKDHLPFVGTTSVEGLYVATGHFRHGILLAPITAHLMAELILSGRSSFDLSPFSLERLNS